MENLLIRKLEGFGPLPDDDRRLLDDIVRRPRSFAGRKDIIREGQPPSDVHLIIEGFACRYKMLKNGNRQIIAYLVPGDFCDLHVFILKEMDHNIATLSPCKVVDIPRERILEMTERTAIARALWWVTLVDEAVLREWLVNMGRRQSDMRIAHLICEMHLRLKLVGLADGNEFELPITQAELGDTLGFSTVHANRALQKLRALELISFRGGHLVIRDPERLQRKCGFKENYLHLNERE